MEPAFQIPRNSMVWLLVAMFAGIGPHLQRLPLWLTLVCLLCGVWRVMVYRSRWRLPGTAIKVMLVVAGCGAVFVHYGRLFGPDAGTALLILGFCFKLVETHSRRDAFIVVILGYFVVATGFLFSQSMLSAAYMLLVSLMVTAALIGLNQSAGAHDPWRTARQALRLVLLSLPLMLVLFLLVPRLGPMWAFSPNSGAAKTGLSERVSPGDIAQLSQSSELAFRVTFDGDMPPMSERYWRALTLSHYDGRSWSRSGQDWDRPPLAQWGASANQNRSEIARIEGEPYRYQVIMSPTDQPWLFALDAATSQTHDVGYSRDHRLVKRTPVVQTFSYEAVSYPRHRLDPQLPDWLARLNTQLPEQGNPRTRALVKQLFAQAGSDAAYADLLMAWFRDNGLVYTLRPPLLSGDRIDALLFETRRGFCSHFAGAFVYMMRLAGIPARIVAGYQGGEVNALGNYLLVHQFDAHAWAEVWFADKGWVRFDPTAMVSPTRRLEGLEQAVEEEGSFLADSVFSAARYRSMPWVGSLRMAFDYINYRWHRSVLGYNAKYQQRLLSEWFGNLSLGRWILILSIGVGAVLGGVALSMLWRTRAPKRHKLDQLYRRFCRKMAHRGLAREPGEAAQNYQLRLSARWPDQAAQLQAVTELYLRLRFAPQTAHETTQVRELARRIRQL